MCIYIYPYINSDISPIPSLSRGHRHLVPTEEVGSWLRNPQKWIPAVLDSNSSPAPVTPVTRDANMAGLMV